MSSKLNVALKSWLQSLADSHKSEGGLGAHLLHEEPRLQVVPDDELELDDEHVELASSTTESVFISSSSVVSSSDKPLK